MDTRTLLARCIERGELCPGTQTVDEWLAISWIRFPICGRDVPLLPLWGLKRALLAHDVHHAVLGFDTTLKGEVALAAWELGSGGCGWNLGFWIDRILAVALGMIPWPLATWRAFRRGIGKRNLYGSDVDALLSQDVADLRARIGVSASP